MPQAVALAAAAVANAAAAVAADVGVSLTAEVAIYQAVYVTAYVAETAGIALIANALGPGLPTPSYVGSSIKEPVPPRRSGYGRARIGGAYMLYEATTNVAYDVIACHDGEIDGFERYWLNDDEVFLDGSADNWVISPDGRKYLNQKVQLFTTTGQTPSTAFAQLVSRIPSVWSSAHRGDGIAALCMIAFQARKKYQAENFPLGCPVPTASARLLKLYDPRIHGTTSKGDPSRWIWSANSVLALLDFLTDADHGMGLDFATVIAPSINDWITAANVCDEQLAVSSISSYLPHAQVAGHNTIDVAGARNLNVGATIEVGYGTAGVETFTVTAVSGTLITLSANMVNNHSAGEEVVWQDGTNNLGYEPRYSCGGVFDHSTAPADVVGQILKSFDGWLGQRGDGSFRVFAGQYQAPTVTLSDDHVLGYSLKHYQTDEEAINQLLPMFTDPFQQFQQAQAGTWDDLADQAARGRVRSQTYDLPWVQSSSQAMRLAKRQMTRLTADLRGTVVTNLYGMNALGERYLTLQISENHSLSNLVVEVTKLEIDFDKLQVAIDWIAADPLIDEWAPGEAGSISNSSRTSLSSLTAPAITAISVVNDTAAGGIEGVRLAITATSPIGSGVDWEVQWRVSGTTDWTQQSFTDVPDGASVSLTTGFVPANVTLEVQVAYVTASASSDWSASFDVATTATGGVSTVTGSGGIAASTSGGSVTVSIAPTGVSAGTYGDAAHFPVIEINTEGQVIAVTTEPVSGGSGTVTSITAGTGLAGGTITGSGTIEIAATGVSAGTYGDATHVPELTINAEGQVTSVTLIPISTGASALSGLSDVNVAEGSAIDGDVLTWNNATSKWIAGAGGSGGSSGSWFPLTTGEEPPVFVTDGEGDLIAVAYAP